MARSQIQPPKAVWRQCKGDGPCSALCSICWGHFLEPFCSLLLYPSLEPLGSYPLSSAAPAQNESH